MSRIFKNPLLIGLLIGWMACQPAQAQVLVIRGPESIVITDSAALRGSLTDETGTGLAVFGTSPTLTTPILGTPASGTLTNCTVADDAYSASTWNGSSAIPTKNAIRDKFESLSSVTTPIYVNVLDHGATVASGDDDTAAIAAAVAACPAGSTLFFPAGTYNTTAEIVLPVDVSMLGEGCRHSGASKIYKTGSGGACINPVDGWTGTISNLFIQSTEHVIITTLTNNIRLYNLSLTTTGVDYWCIYCENNTFDNIYQGLIVGSPGYVGNGVMICGHTTLTDVNLAGTKEGIRAWSVNNHIDRVRAEVNYTAIKLGYDYNDDPYELKAASVNNISFESNDTAIIVNANHCHFHGWYLSAIENATPPLLAPIGDNADYGLKIVTANSCTFDCMTITGHWDDHPAITWGTVYGCHFSNITSSNATGAPGWSNSASPFSSSGNPRNTFTNCPGLKWNSSDNEAAHNSFGEVQTASLRGHDALSATRPGKNLRGINIAVTETATTKAVVFSNSMSGGNCDIASLTASSAGGSLTGGETYYYRVSGVTANGEAAGGSEQSVTLGGSDNRVAVSCYGTSGRVFKIRVYRGTAAGVYDGCYETTLNGTTYTDTGVAFDIADAEYPASGRDNSCLEPDASFAVLVTPNWLTTHRVTSKATTGFTVDFGTAAPAGATFDYIMVR